MINNETDNKEIKTKELKLNFTSRFKGHNFNVFLKHTYKGWETFISGRIVNSRRNGDMIINDLSAAEGVELSSMAKHAFQQAWEDLDLPYGVDIEKISSKLSNALREE